MSRDVHGAGKSLSSGESLSSVPFHVFTSFVLLFSEISDVITKLQLKKLELLMMKKAIPFLIYNDIS